jgi:Bacterial Ig-like domain
VIRGGRAWIAGSAAVGVLLAAAAAVPQPRVRRITTTEAIRAYPGFYHAQPVLVRAEVHDTESPPVLVSGEARVPLLTRETVPAGPGPYDVRGEVIDIGRLAQDDPRLSGIDLHKFGIDPTDRWPRQGEVVVLRPTSFDRAQPLTAPTVRNLALDPLRYADEHVTVTGQFRGRNLFGDLPQAPAAAAKSKSEFVLKSADGAIWVLGKQPKGHGWSMDPDSRIDTRRWIEATGTVHFEQGLVWIDAEEVREAQPQKEEVTTEAPPPATPIPPEVLFSAPTADETDVPLNTHVRIQFSRDLNPETLKGHIRIGYSAQQSSERGEPQPPGIEPVLRYDPAARVLDISFAAPLERFRTVVVELLEGISGTDGAPLKPWRLSFTLGGS